ncbi:MAG: ATP-binding protein [Thermoleophilia bacterium]|nr:ATP-binding protein [Thermoleophilia bacterium]
MITDLNPFIYSRPVMADDVIDRDEETRRLLQAAVGGHYVRLYAPRKYGKTSLLQRVLRDGERDEGIVPVLVDLYGVLSLADVTIRVERAYARQLKGPFRTRVDDFLKSTGLGLSLGALGIGVRLQIERDVDPLPALHALLDLPLRLAADGGTRALVVFDEFQDVSKVAGMDAILRSHVQYQGDAASYVFSGSEPGLMRELFETAERPLYGQAVAMRLERLRDGDIAAYVVDRFRRSDRDVGDALEPLLRAAEGHPQRAMLLAHRVWDELPRGEHADRHVWRRALERTLLELAPEFEARWQRYSVTEQKTLRALVSGDGSPYRERELERLGLAKSSAQQALRKLVSRGEVERADGRYAVVDPLFGRWAARLGAPVSAGEE